MLPEFKTPLVLILIPLLLALFWYEHSRREGTSFKFSSLSLMQPDRKYVAGALELFTLGFKGIGFDFIVDCLGWPPKDAGPV